MLASRFFSLLYDHRCAAACHHEHRSALSYGFVVEVDAYDGVAAEALGTLRHFAHGRVLSFAQYAFVGAAATAEEVAQACHEVFENIGADDGFAGYYAAIFADGVPFEGGCC